MTVAVAATGAAMVLMAPSPASAASTCANPNANKALTSTQRSVDLFGRTFQLRFNKGSGCAWGRVVNGSPNDEIWVDWAENDNAATHSKWQQLSKRLIPHGATSTSTVGYFDGQSNYMRACGKAGNRAQIVCTDWY